MVIVQASSSHKRNPYKEKILAAMLPHVPFEGWSEDLFGIIAKELGEEEESLRLHFEGGIIDVVDYFSSRNDLEMLRRFKKLSVADSEMRIRDRVKNSIVARLEIYDEMKVTIAKTVAFLSLPWNLTKSSSMTWRTVDIIWKESAGDASTDFNYYTKRALLMGIYTSVVMYWLADDSENYEDTLAFLDNRINDVMKVGKILSLKPKK